MAGDHLDKALSDPSAVYGQPSDVLGDERLSEAQKVEVLRRWESLASSEAVALEEGMPGEDSELLTDILVALGKLTGPLDLDHTGPSKAHGLPRSAIRSTGKS
ncbi:MAG: hypothetical protein R3D65_04230 [Zhengella sp.]|uniref:hypothetical protein n=1 Tax=Zhengella sp. TaxID=2282762 RepID=UPI001D52DB70|nr:hypothetical protein [Notoacmeibacter sp.]MCC0026049.1 hypothetical protein [Brucellaceae bacterium]